MESYLSSQKKTARLAGFLYLIWVITGLTGLMYISPKIFVPGDIIATAKNILNNEFLFRTSIINDLISITVCVFLVLTLYRLLKQVNEHQARQMVAFLFATIPVVFIMEAFNITALMILKGEILKTFELSQGQDIAMVFLKINDYCAFALELFWGLWLIPLGQLIYKSKFMPSVLGIFLILNGVAYIIPGILSLLLPDYRTIISQIAMPFWILGEISITLWLLIKGVKSQPDIIVTMT
jgi:hypothetical protein